MRARGPYVSPGTMYRIICLPLVHRLRSVFICRSSLFDCDTAVLFFRYNNRFIPVPAGRIFRYFMAVYKQMCTVRTCSLLPYVFVDKRKKKKKT